MNLLLNNPITKNRFLAALALKQIKENTYYAEKFKDFPYDDWKPAKQRYDFVNKYFKGVSLLDIGCGHYPVSAEVNVPRKVGIDVSIKAAKKSWKEFDDFYFLDITKVNKKLLGEQLGKFDTIVASEILEHLENPEDVIKKISYLLNSNGRVLVTVPNGNSLAGTIDKIGNKGQYNRFKLYHRTNVSLLSTKEWVALFEGAGLEVEVFDFRPSDIGIEGFPKESSKTWKAIARKIPNLLAHQFFFVLRKADKKGGGR